MNLLKVDLGLAVKKILLKLRDKASISKFS